MIRSRNINIRPCITSASGVAIMFSRVYFSALACATLLALPVQAATIGTAVDGIGSSNTVGATEYRPLLGSDAIKYFIPLTSSGSCTYGVDCGEASDSGYGGTEMSMFLRFDGVNTSQPSSLTIAFEDLDLIGVNDPWYFLEDINVFDSSNTSMTGLITNIASPFVTGNYDTQQFLSFDLGVLSDTTYFLELVFTANSKYFGRNTPEYLVAEISVVPLPATGLLLLGGMAGLGAMSRRRSRR